MKNMKYLLVFVLAVFCIAGCGKKETETKEKGTVVDKNYIKFTLKEGWEMDDKSGDANNLTGSIYLTNVGSQNILRPTIRFEYRRGDTPKEELEFWKGMYNTTKRMDNVTIKGTEYMVLNDDSPMGKTITLYTSPGKFDENKRGSVSIQIANAKIEDVMSVLETISIK